MKFVLSTKRLGLDEAAWKAFLEGKKPATAARYERERQRYFRILKGVYENILARPQKPKLKRVSVSAKSLTRANLDKIIMRTKAKEPAMPKGHFYSFTVKLLLPSGFTYHVRVPATTSYGKAVEILQHKLTELATSYEMNGVPALRVQSFRAYAIQKGYRFARKR